MDAYGLLGFVSEVNFHGVSNLSIQSRSKKSYGKMSVKFLYSGLSKTQLLSKKSMWKGPKVPLLVLKLTHFS